MYNHMKYICELVWHAAQYTAAAPTNFIPVLHYLIVLLLCTVHVWFEIIPILCAIACQFSRVAGEYRAPPLSGARWVVKTTCFICFQAPIFVFAKKNHTQNNCRVEFISRRYLQNFCLAHFFLPLECIEFFFLLFLLLFKRTHSHCCENKQGGR